MIIGSLLYEENIYNGIYEALRLKLVSLGHIPDRTLCSTAAEYKTAVEALRVADGGHIIIEVHNANSGITRQEMKKCGFYINSKNRNNGDYGGGKATFEDYQNETDQLRYRKIFMPAKPQDIDIEISYKNDSSQIDRLMRSILMTVLGERSYIPSYSNNGTAGDDFLLMFNGEVTMDNGNWLDKRASFTAKDLILYDPLLLQDDIMPTNEITPLMGADEVVDEIPEDI